MSDDPPTPLPRVEIATKRGRDERPAGPSKLTSVVPAKPAALGPGVQSGGRHFMRISAGNPWLVCRSPEHSGKLFWLHEETGESTWRQPLPRAVLLPEWPLVHASMREMALRVTDATFFGAPASQSDPKARTGICGVRPTERPLRGTCELLSPEHGLYPRPFLAAVGVRRFLMCEELNYNGQRRRDVPDLASGSLYIDVGDRAVRRKRHSFHHELWHMVDYHLLGNAFESADAEWSTCNPEGFRYGHGGKHMRGDSNSSQLSSAPSAEFLNRYSTSSIAEDKAEVWACLMCYQSVLNSKALLAKAAILKARARALCDAMDEAWWDRVVKAQLEHTDHWEIHYTDAFKSRAFWCNWVTDERRWDRPKETALYLDLQKR